MLQCLDVATFRCCNVSFSQLCFLTSNKQLKPNHMGATKTKQYSADTIQLAKLANALGHPARITIIKTLQENSSFRFSEFQKILQLSHTTVQGHLSKLRSAYLIEYDYYPHEYHVRLNSDYINELNYFLSN
jgi:DNA-binding transcriptional ArsR family regulator